MSYYLNKLSDYNGLIGPGYSGNSRFDAIRFISINPKRLSYNSLHEETVIEISDAKNAPTYHKLSQSYKSTISKLSEYCVIPLPFKYFSRQIFFKIRKD